MRNVSAYNLFKVLLVFGLAVIIISWQPKRSKNAGASKKFYDTDTSKPGNSSDDAVDFDMNDLDVEMKELNKEMMKLNEVDFAKIKTEIKASLDSINFNKVNVEVQRSLKSIDWNKINKDINASLKDAQLQVAKINSEQMKANLEQVKVQLEKQKLDFKIDSEKMKEQLQKGMQQLHESMNRMKASFAAYKKLTAALQKDGVIDTAKGYSIKIKNGDMFINGKKQTAAVAEKYKAYLPEGKGDFTLKKDYDGEEDDEGENL